MSGEAAGAGAAAAAERTLDPKIAIFKVPPFPNQVEFGHAVFKRVLRQGPRRPLKQFETGTPLGRAKITWSKMGTSAVAYIALLASRLPWFLGGAAPDAAGAGCA